MHFHGTKNGRRLDRTKFRSQEGFLEELDTSYSNAIFVKTLSKLGIGQKKTKRKNTPNTISNAMPNPLYANMMAITSSQSEELDFVKNKLVGTLIIQIYTKIGVWKCTKKKRNSKLNFNYINYKNYRFK